jgi:hypothetical protein
VDTLHQLLEQVVADLPKSLLETLISKKLGEQGISAAKGLGRRLAAHVLSGNNEPFRYKTGRHTREIALHFDEADANEITQAFERFAVQLPKLLPGLADRSAKRVLKNLNSRWAHEHSLQTADLSVFREGLEGRWGIAIGQLRMLLTISREWCQDAYRRAKAQKRRKHKQLREILARLLARGLQVTDEILCLLENGFADGAMARWRTLHEIAVVATVIAQHGESITERYLAHQAVESKRAMDKYQACCPKLGYKPLSLRAQKRIEKAYDQALARYGHSFKSDYGWAALHLKESRPTFAHLEAAAGRTEMRAHYQMGNDNIHAGIKSIYVRLGLLGKYDRLLAGRSNAGLIEPGQNAAHTLTELSVLVCLWEPRLDDLVIGQVMRRIRDEIPKSFARAHRQLLRDDKRYRVA